MDDTIRARIEEANRRHFNAMKNNRVVEILGPGDLKNLIIRGMRGLGDNINQRAFLKELGVPVFLDTPWPELYSDMSNVTFIPCQTVLRTQNKNMSRQPVGWYKEPPSRDAVELKVQYGSVALQRGSMYRELSRLFGGIRPKVFDLPRFECSFRSPNPVAVVRPATVRKEWAAVSRNPKPEYIAQASRMLMDAGFYVVSIADLEPGVEWLVGEPPPASIQYHRGELPVDQLLGLCQYADVLVGGHGFLTHVALCEKKPMLCILGGFGGDNSPHQIADPDFLDVSCVNFLVPDRFCKCTVMSHTGCDKTISNFDQKVKTWIESLKK